MTSLHPCVYISEINRRILQLFESELSQKCNLKWLLPTAYTLLGDIRDIQTSIVFCKLPVTMAYI